MIHFLFAVQLLFASLQSLVPDDFSGVVMLAKDGKPVFEQAYGPKNNVDTKFNLGSINKLFTQVAIAQLAQAGKLSLDDTVRKHLPDYPSPVADKITVRQLVEFRSGLGDFFGPEFLATPPAKIRKLSDYLPLFVNKPLLFEPGTDQRYSNAGYIVLGLIIERVSGQSYYDYVREHIFKPAAMRDTDSYAIDDNVPNRATPVTKRGELQMPGRGSSAGGGYSTAHDLLRFANALRANKLLEPKWTSWVFKGGSNLGVAGGAPGISATLLTEPPYTLAVLANMDPPAAEEIARAARPLLGLPPAERRVAAAAEPDEVTIRGPLDIPFTLARGHVPMIEATINGKGPFHIAVDTGFGGLLQVSPRVAEELKLPVVGEVRTGDPSGRSPKTVPLHRVESLDIGTLHFGGIAAGEHTVMDDVDGVIGLNLFHGLLVTFDYPKQRFAVRGGKLADGLPYTLDHGIPAIDIDVNGQPMRVHIDSGSPAQVTLPRSVATSLPLAEEPRVVGHGRTADGDFDVYAAPLKGKVSVGSIVLANPQLDFIDVFPIGNLGYRFLKDLVVTFDPASRRVKFAQ